MQQSNVYNVSIVVPRSIVTSPILTAISSDDEDPRESTYLQQRLPNDSRLVHRSSPAYIQQHHQHDDDDAASSVTSSNISQDNDSDHSFTCSEMDVVRRPSMGKPGLNPTMGPSTPGSIVAGLPIEAQKWDYLLNYGPSFNSLVGVCNDIANLPDANKPKVCNNVNKYYFIILEFTFL